jgi:hypothetical protein
MLKLLRLGLFALVVSGLNIQSASACCWRLWNPFNSCCSNNFCSPCYTPCQPAVPYCNPCQGISVPTAPFPIGPAFHPANPGCNSCQSSFHPGYNRTNSFPTTGNYYPQTLPQQVVTPPTWTTTPQSTVPPTDIQYPLETGSLNSTQTEWESVKQGGVASQITQESEFKNVTLQSKSKVSYKRKRSFRAPSAVAVWQHMTSAR